MMKRMTRIPRRRRAYTLIELVLSMAVMTVLLGGLSSAMMIASRAVPDRNTTLGATLDSANAGDQLAAELFVAKSFSVRSPTAVEFTLADRNADGIDETIRYEWSGAPGASLTRKYNADAAVTVVADVNEFTLVYNVAAVQQTTPSASNESAETLLVGYTSTTGLADWAIADKQFIGQYFKPTLPADATSWKVTRVRLVARIHGANKGISRVQLQTANASNQPSGTTLEEKDLLESELSDAYLWKELSFKNVSGVTPGAGLCLIVTWITDAHACDIQYQNAGAALANSNLITTTNAGSPWTSSPGQSMLFDVYGTITAPTPPVVTQQYYLTGIRIKLRAGNNADARTETFVQVLNEPEVNGL